MKCTRCQTQLRNDAKFCPVCGTRVKRRSGMRFTTVLVTIVILLNVTVIGGVVGILLTEGIGGNKPVVTLFFEETVSPKKGDGEVIDHVKQIAEDEAKYLQDSVDLSYDESAADTYGADTDKDYNPSGSFSDSTDTPGFGNAPTIPEALSDEQLRKISAVLGVPEDLDTQITQGEPTYWEGGDMYRTLVEIYYDDEFIAGANVDSFTGNIAGTISTYSAPDDPILQPTEEFQAVMGFVSNADGGLNVRESPSTSSKSVRRIYNGEPVVITEQLVADGLHWGRISSGWICTNYVTFEGESGTLGDYYEETSPEVYMVSPSAGAVNVRSDAGTLYQSIRRIAGGEELVIYEQTTAEGRTWGRTDIGWVCMDYLIPSGFEMATEYDGEDIGFSEFEEENGNLDDFFV